MDLHAADAVTFQRRKSPYTRPTTPEPAHSTPRYLSTSLEGHTTPPTYIVESLTESTSIDLTDEIENKNDLRSKISNKKQHKNKKKRRDRKKKSAVNHLTAPPDQRITQPHRFTATTDGFTGSNAFYPHQYIIYQPGPYYLLKPTYGITTRTDASNRRMTIPYIQEQLQRSQTKHKSRWGEGEMEGCLVSKSSLESQQTAALTQYSLSLPATFISRVCWPSTYLVLAVIGALLTPLPGVLALYSAIVTKEAINRGYYNIAIERSQNTKILIFYTYLITLITVFVTAVASAIVVFYAGIFALR